jgi:hypothetical protein
MLFLRRLRLPCAAGSLRIGNPADSKKDDHKNNYGSSDEPFLDTMQSGHARRQ